MANGWSVQNYGIIQSSTGVVTDLPISKEYPITGEGAKYCVIKLVFSGVTVVGGITAKLQSAIGSDWVNSKTVAVTADGNYYIKLLAEAAGDQTYLPLLNKGRIVVTTTNAGDVFTVVSAEILQPL